MRVLLISANTERINLPTFPLGLACVAQSTLDRGHEVECLDLMAEKETEEAVTRTVKRFQPQVIGISVRNIDDQNMANPRFLLEQAKDVVKFCRSVSGSPTVLGGAGYSLFPDSSLEYLGADLGIQGEGEIAFPLLMEALERDRPLPGLPGLYLRGQGLQGERRFAEDLDSLIGPDDDLLYPRFYMVVKGLESWLRETVAKRLKEHRNWLM